jgi:hypothetical protein
MKLLLTGFTPFDGEAINPALEAVKRLPNEIAGMEIVKLEVPTVFGESVRLVAEAIEREQPDFVLSVGQAGGRTAVTPERVAINVDDARIPDNVGQQPIDIPIFADGENAYFATLPVKAMTDAIRKAGLPSALSNTAGTYVCNHLMYGVLYHLNQKNSRAKAGFIHVPYIPEQTADKPGVPSMPLDDIVRALEAAIAAIPAHETDIKTAHGREW